jgi:hypothetical protein
MAIIGGASVKKRTLSCCQFVGYWSDNSSAMSKPRAMQNVARAEARAERFARSRPTRTTT